MIECYYKWCENHCKDEPFCPLQECIAKEVDLVKWAEYREEELFQNSVKEASIVDEVNGSKREW